MAERPGIPRLLLVDVDLDTASPEGPALSRGTALTLIPDEDLARIIDPGTFTAADLLASSP